MRKLKLWVGFVALVAIPMQAWAYVHDPSPLILPEPESLALIGIGAVALIVARWRKKK